VLSWARQAFSLSRHIHIVPRSERKLAFGEMGKGPTLIATNGHLGTITESMNREFQIFASAQDNRFVLRRFGDSQPREFCSLFEAARHARIERNCERGLVLICAYCRRVGADQDYWSQIEAYLLEDSGLKLSHGVCQDCFEGQARELGLPLPRPLHFRES